ncbi:MAG: RHS repeat-associated core domain-containing protein, partial [Pseudomonas sp.]
HARTWKGPWLLREGRYHYDCLGRRIAKDVTLHDQDDRDEPDTERTAFVWQGLRLLLEHKRELHSLYVYEPDSYAPLARIDTDPLQPERRAQRYYFHTDQLGTPLDMTDENGQFVWRGFYKAWGRVEAKTPTPLEQNLRLQGQYYDAETFLHYNTFRYYDPAVGRFTTQDPIGLEGGVNLYRYGSNPTGWVDPLGLAPKAPLSLPNGFKGRIDRFNLGTKSSFEVHVYAPTGREVGIYGPNGFINKHGISASDVKVPENVSRTLNGIAIDELRKTGSLPKKGTPNSRKPAQAHTKKIKNFGSTGC